MRRFATLTLACLAIPCLARAQNAAPVSLQFSALYNTLGGSDYSNVNAGIGGEAQIRRTLGTWSVGGGFQMTHHSFDEANAGIGGSMNIYGAFFEPRYVIPSRGNVAPYLSARLALLRQSYATDLFDAKANGVQGNLGGGALLALSGNTNLDLGATFGVVNFGNLKITSSDTPGLEIETGSGSGSNLIVRVGLSIGIGR